MKSLGILTKRTEQFSALLNASRPHFLMEAHSPLSAKIAEEAGFSALWASSLSISAAMGLRDCNEASWTQVLEVAEQMADVTSVPILLDADSGYGNFNNVRRLVRKSEARGIAAVCIEDKLFPKKNSFLDSERQELSDIEEFSGKIRAAVDTRRDGRFAVIARTEALVCGRGLDEALERAHAYCDSGADGILVHSRHQTAAEIEAFMKSWNGRAPVIVVPTTYAATPADLFAALGISLVIWANFMIRASVAAMQRVARLMKDDGPRAAQQDIVSINEIFRLQDVAELEAAEKRYLPEKPARTASESLEDEFECADVPVLTGGLG